MFNIMYQAWHLVAWLDKHIKGEYKKIQKLYSYKKMEKVNTSVIVKQLENSDIPGFFLIVALYVHFCSQIFCHFIIIIIMGIGCFRTLKVYVILEV